MNVMDKLFDDGQTSQSIDPIVLGRTKDKSWLEKYEIYNQK